MGKPFCVNGVGLLMYRTSSAENFVLWNTKKNFQRKHVHGFDSKRNVLLVAVVQSFAKCAVRKDMEVGS